MFGGKGKFVNFYDSGDELFDVICELGISSVWNGLEGESSQYAKLKGIDRRILVRELQSHGIRILGTSIIGMENHSPSNIDQVIDYTVSHATDFHQFMLYTALADSGKDRPRRLAGNPGRGGQNVSSNRFGHATMRHITLSF